jgi:hypothetical protein
MLTIVCPVGIINVAKAGRKPAAFVLALLLRSISSKALRILKGAQAIFSRISHFSQLLSFRAHLR